VAGGGKATASVGERGGVTVELVWWSGALMAVVRTVDIVAAVAGRGVGSTGGDGWVTQAAHSFCSSVSNKLVSGVSTRCGGESSRPSGRCVCSALESSSSADEMGELAGRFVDAHSPSNSVFGPKADGPSRPWNGSSGRHGSASSPHTRIASAEAVGGVESACSKLGNWQWV
jgi:hypothetical protein